MPRFNWISTCVYSICVSQLPSLNISVYLSLLAEGYNTNVTVNWTKYFATAETNK